MTTASESVEVYFDMTALNSSYDDVNAGALFTCDDPYEYLVMSGSFIFLMGRYGKAISTSNCFTEFVGYVPSDAWSYQTFTGRNEFKSEIEIFLASNYTLDSPLGFIEIKDNNSISVERQNAVISVENSPWSYFGYMYMYNVSGPGINLYNMFETYINFISISNNENLQNYAGSIVWPVKL
jgi:hypothetical protein